MSWRRLATIARFCNGRLKTVNIPRTAAPSACLRACQIDGVPVLLAFHCGVYWDHCSPRLRARYIAYLVNVASLLPGESNAVGRYFVHSPLRQSACIARLLGTNHVTLSFHLTGIAASSSHIATSKWREPARQRRNIIRHRYAVASSPSSVFSPADGINQQTAIISPSFCAGADIAKSALAQRRQQ